MIQRLRFAPKPVVAAPFGNTLGLGVELSLASAAHLRRGRDIYGARRGRRWADPRRRAVARNWCAASSRRRCAAAASTPCPSLRRVLETIVQAKVSTSAAEARDLGYLGEHDRIVLGRDRLLTEAKRMALDLADAGYQPPLPGKTCYAAGQGALASLLVGIYQYRAGRIYLRPRCDELREEWRQSSAAANSPRRNGWTRNISSASNARHSSASCRTQDTGADRAFLQTGKPLRN